MVIMEALLVVLATTLSLRAPTLHPATMEGPTLAQAATILLVLTLLEPMPLLSLRLREDTTTHSLNSLNNSSTVMDSNSNSRGEQHTSPDLLLTNPLLSCSYSARSQEQQGGYNGFPSRQ